MKKEIVVAIIIFILIVGVSTFFWLRKNNVTVAEKNAESGVEEVEAEEYSDSNEDPDVDLDLESVPLDLNDDEKNEFNYSFEDYDDKTLNTEQTKELIDLVINTNLKYQGDGKRFISIDNNDYSNMDDKLYMRCLDANPYYGGDNTNENVEDANKEIENFRDSLADKSKYIITLVKGRDIIVEISIMEV